MSLTALDELALTKVLDYSVSLTRKNTPKLLPLSLYISELKGREQIAGCLKTIRDGKPLSDVTRSRDRYFNSLFNQGLVDGNASSPVLTALANFYLEPLDQGADSGFWQEDGGDQVEAQVIRALVRELSLGRRSSEFFKNAWYGAQTFFDYVPDEEIASILNDRERMLFLFHINSNGWEIGRYFSLSSADRMAFEQAFKKIKPSKEWTPQSPIEIAATQYKDAAQTTQNDVRFRISGFLKAFKLLKDELGEKLPRLDRKLVLRSSVYDGAEAHYPEEIRAPRKIHPDLPRQLIITGCPGSGKSYYVNELVKTADYVVRTQFHPESSFFDFVGAYKPHPVYEAIDSSHPLVEGDGTLGLRGRPLIDYRFVPGPFMRALAYALLNPSETVAVVIEELNRGNAASILGDVLQLLDRDQVTGASQYEIDITPEQKSYFSSLGVSVNSLRLPSNLFIWATMNNADQGVFPLDTAFRRRWNYVYKGYTEVCGYPAENCRIEYGGLYYNWDQFRGVLNNHLVEQGIHEDKLIGPYFLTEQQLANSEAVLQKLFLYLWDDVLRFRQETLFLAKSFSGVSRDWKDGKGSPLTGLFNSALSKAIQEQSDAEDPILAPEET